MDIDSASIYIKHNIFHFSLYKYLRIEILITYLIFVFIINDVANHC